MNWGILEFLVTARSMGIWKLITLLRLNKGHVVLPNKTKLVYNYKHKEVMKITGNITKYILFCALLFLLGFSVLFVIIWLCCLLWL